MKKSKKQNLGKKLLSSILSATMAAELIPGMALNVNAEVNQDLVSALTEAYDGDEARAAEELELLHQAGIIDENGNMIALDIKENGVAVQLEEVAARIAGGEKVGELTVNGHAVPNEQVMKINQLNGTLKMIQMLNEDVEITDEHVKNLESLIKGIGDGSIDIDSAIENGKLSLEGMKSPMPTKAAVNNDEEDDEDSDFPETKTSTGTISASSDGKYTGRYIKDSEYEQNHQFELADPENKTFYTDSRFEGLISDGTITMSCASTVSCGSTVTVTATLNKAQANPVSFDYEASGASLGVSGKGTVTWEAARAFVIRAGNIKNAVFSDNSTAWNNTVTVSASDREENIRQTYSWVKVDTYKASDFIPTTTRVDTYSDKNGTQYHYIWAWSKQIKFEGDEIRFTVNWKGQNTYMGYLDPCYSISNEPNDASWSYSRGQKYDRQPNDEKAIFNGSSSFTARVNIGETKYVNLGFQSLTHTGETDTCSLQSATYEVRKPVENTTISSYSVPASTYYSGQTVPVTVNFNDYVMANANTKLVINNTECSALDVNTEEKSITFGYTVKPVDSGSIIIGNLTGLVNAGDKAVTIDGNTPSKNSFDTKDGVTLVSDVKRSSIDFDNIKFGISDDEPGEQVITALIPFKSGADTTWIINENEEFAEKGQPIKLPLPGMPNATSNNYLKGAYFSYDNGKTRYPVYIVNNGAQEGAALAVRFAPTLNATACLRKDTLNLFLDNTVGITEVTTYLDTWENKKTDSKGFAYFDGTGKASSAPIVVGQNYEYYTKGGVMFDPTAYISRGEEDYTEKFEKESGFLKLEKDKNIIVQDTEHPENQYDVEIVANDAMYDAIAHGGRAEDTSDFTLKYQFSSRKNFTFVEPKYFAWKSSNQDIARITTDDKGVAHISFTGKPGDTEITLAVGNGSPAKSFTMTPVKLTVLEGKTPFLSISSYSQMRPTLTNTDIDVMFASNVTIRNAQAKHDKTIFTGKLYKTEPVEGKPGEYKKVGEPIWTGEFESTEEATISHITVPGSELSKKGIYAAEVSTTYYGGEVDGKETQEKKDLTATAYLDVSQAPVSVTLNQLESYYCTSSDIPVIGYRLSDVEGEVEVEYTIQKSGEDVSERMSASG